MDHNTQTIKIALVDDHTIMRQGIISQLVTDTGLEIIMEARHGLDLLEQLKRSSVMPDIIVFDLSMPVMNGFTLSTALKAKYPLIKTLVLTGYYSEYNIAMMVNNGARGYLLKSMSSSELKRAIHSVHETGYYYSDILTKSTFKTFQNTRDRSYNIPEREMEFLKLCCTELRYDEIADHMGISPKTLEGCRGRLFERLELNSRVELMLFAMQSGIFTPNINN